MVKLKNIEELEAIAVKVIDGDIEPLEIDSLSFIDEMFVMSLANVYSLVKVGTMSQKSGAKFKYKFLQRYSALMVKLFFQEKIYIEQTERRKTASKKLCELASELKKSEYTTDTLAQALKVIDLLTADDVYFNLMQYSKSEVLQTANANIDTYIKQFGNQIPFAMQIEKFFSSVNEDNLKDLWVQLRGEDFGKKARRMVAKDGEAVGMANSLEVIYGNGKGKQEETNGEELQ